MQSFLITAKDKNKSSSYISNFLKEKGIDPFDISLHSFEKAVGIEDVRNIQKTVILKPFKGKVKAVIIQTYENVTTEAQNALLKVLEEPPANTIIIISAEKKEFLLPTIISRCKIIELKERNLTLSSEENAQYLNLLISSSSSSVGQKLKLAQDLAKNKEDVIPWLEKMILTARQAVLTKYKNEPTANNRRPETNDYLNILISLQKTHTVLKTTNVNPRLALENLFLSF